MTIKKLLVALSMIGNAFITERDRRAEAIELVRRMSDAEFEQLLCMCRNEDEKETCRKLRAGEIT